jgi:hypothetical protein
VHLLCLRYSSSLYGSASKQDVNNQLIRNSTPTKMKLFLTVVVRLKLRILGMYLKPPITSLSNAVALLPIAAVAATAESTIESV